MADMYHRVINAWADIEHSNTLTHHCKLYDVMFPHCPALQ